MAYKTTILKHSRSKYMTVVPQEEAITAMKDLSPKAYQLLIYYYSRGDGWIFEDNEISNTLNISERMVKQYRKELIDKEYLFIVKGQLTVYFIGRKAVFDFKYEENDKDNHHRTTQQ